MKVLQERVVIQIDEYNLETEAAEAVAMAVTPMKKRKIHWFNTRQCGFAFQIGTCLQWVELDFGWLFFSYHMMNGWITLKKRILQMLYLF